MNIPLPQRTFLSHPAALTLGTTSYIVTCALCLALLPERQLQEGPGFLKFCFLPTTQHEDDNTQANAE